MRGRLQRLDMLLITEPVDDHCLRHVQRPHDFPHVLRRTAGHRRAFDHQYIDSGLVEATLEVFQVVCSGHELRPGQLNLLPAQPGGDSRTEHGNPRMPGVYRR